MGGGNSKPAENTKPNLKADVADKKKSSASTKKPFVSNTQENIVAKYVGVLKVKDTGEYLGVATLIRKNVILTARHLLNDLSLGDLLFEFSSDFSSAVLGVIEDGSDEQYGRSDYILLQVDCYFESGIYPKLSLLSQNSKFSLIGKNQEWCLCPAQGEFETLDSGIGAPVSITSRVPSDFGYCGAPYVDNQGNIFGIHLKASHGSMFDEQRTGLLLMGYYHQFYEV